MILQQQAQLYEQQQHPTVTTMEEDFYNPTTLWAFLTECLHWQYTGVYWPKGSTGKQYGIDFFYNTEEVKHYCQQHQYHLLYASEYQHWYNLKFGGSGKHMSYGRMIDSQEDFGGHMNQPSRKKAKTSAFRDNDDSQHVMNFSPAPAYVPFNSAAATQNNSTTMEC